MSSTNAVVDESGRELPSADCVEWLSAQPTGRLQELDRELGGGGGGVRRRRQSLAEELGTRLSPTVRLVVARGSMLGQGQGDVAAEREGHTVGRGGGGRREQGGGIGRGEQGGGVGHVGIRNRGAGTGGVLVRLTGLGFPVVTIFVIISLAFFFFWQTGLVVDLEVVFEEGSGDAPGEVCDIIDAGDLLPLLSSGSGDFSGDSGDGQSLLDGSDVVVGGGGEDLPPLDRALRSLDSEFHLDGKAAGLPELPGM